MLLFVLWLHLLIDEMTVAAKSASNTWVKHFSCGFGFRHYLADTLIGGLVRLSSRNPSARLFLLLLYSARSDLMRLGAVCGPTFASINNDNGPDDVTCDSFPWYNGRWLNQSLLDSSADHFTSHGSVLPLSKMRITWWVVVGFYLFKKPAGRSWSALNGFFWVQLHAVNSYVANLHK